MQPNAVDVRYFKLGILLDQIIQVWNQSFTLSGCKDIEIGKFDFVAETQLLERLLCLV